jgi:hypothetical protein
MKGPLSRVSRTWVRRAGVPFLAFVALSGWALASPVGAGADEDYHLVSIWCAQGENPGFCEPVGNPSLRRVPLTFVFSALCYRESTATSASCMKTATVNGLKGDDGVVTFRGNFAGSYPPVYYSTASTLATSNIDASVVAIRLLNSAIFVALVTATYFLSERRRRSLVVLPALLTMVPVGMFFIASINPTSWGYTSATVVWIAFLGFFERSGWQRFALGGIGVLATIVGAGARADAAAFAGLAVVVAALLAARREKSPLVTYAIPAATVAFAGMLYLASGQNRAVTAGLGDPYKVPLDLGKDAVWLHNLVAVPDLWAGVFGTKGPQGNWGLGWGDTFMPGSVPVLVGGVFVAALAFGLTAMNRRKGAALVLVAGAAYLIPLYVLGETPAYVGDFFTPRYLVPLLVIGAGVALYRPDDVTWSVPRLHAGLAVGALAIAHAIALHTTTRRYLTGDDVVNVNLNAHVEWWWSGAPAPMLVWFLASGAFLGVAWALVRQVDARSITASAAEDPSAFI